MKIIIDTDPGLDDAVAILYALAEPRFELLAVTSVAGNIGLDRTTENAGRLLALMGSDAPVASGARGPLKGKGIDEEGIHGADGLGGIALPEPRHPALPDGVALMASTLMAQPEGSVTILALGPLTNLALLHRGYPRAFARIGRIIAMGGNIHETGNVGPHAEFNIIADALAADIVLGTGVDFTLIPLDVTRKFRATPDDLLALKTSGKPAATTSAALIEAYFKGSDRESRPLHDPCVMLLAMDPALFGCDEMRLRVDRDVHPGKLIEDAGRPPIRVAMRIEAEAVKAMLWSGLTR